MSVQLWGGPINVSSITDAYQNSADIAVLADGRFVVVWVDSSTSDTRILQRVFNADGSPATAEFVAIENPPVDLVNPVVTVLPAGGWAVTAADVEGGQGSVLFFDGDGSVAESILVYFAGTAVNTHLDGFLVGANYWIMESDAAADNQIDVFINSLDGNAHAFNTIFTAQTDTSGTQVDPAGAQINNGNVVLAWRESDTIEFTIVDDTGVAVSGSDTVVTVPGRDAALSSYGKPDILALENGGFLITWASDSSDFPGAGFDVWGRIYGPDGSAFSAEPFLVNSNVSENQFSAKAVPLKSGGFAVFFNTNTLLGTGIKGQLFDSLGSKLGQEFQVSSNGPLDDISIDEVSAAMLQDGRIAVTYTVIDSDAGGSNLRMQIVDPRDGNISGGADGDSLYGNRGNDDMFGGDGADVLNGMEGQDLLFGGHGDDILIGGDGNDRLVGDAGADHMVGGVGNDVYYVDDAGDTIAEDADSGNDLVFSFVSFALRDHSANLEHLKLYGSENINGTGNALANTITGNSGNNVLNGGGGNDTLIGGLGNDIFLDNIGAERMVGGGGNDVYYVDDAGDRIEEVGNNGTDHVFSYISFALRDHSAHLENLNLLGTGNSSGVGNGLANSIVGNSGNNSLNGGGGSDTLSGGLGNDFFADNAGNDRFTGGGGADTFFFFGVNENDIITDFEDGIDTIRIAIGVGSFDNVIVTDQGADTLLSFATNTVLLQNFTDHTLIEASDFEFV
ncbi:calcium-binding protein [Cohaesibacter sp. CAU 1516]|uniref:calcium-binding protein n=1 Tax=Cohaesibacter sp. CAU 1516 TaxID=2576038 RepID=UPI0010FEA90A|nr:calcium-binding protein [Cohaesibacter sp. CAU 1516]TLP46903.1 calcium-binding protein [Cohaesibacter sp. CAU 1516]